MFHQTPKIVPNKKAHSNKYKKQCVREISENMLSTVIENNQSYFNIITPIRHNNAQCSPSS